MNFRQSMVEGLLELKSIYSIFKLLTVRNTAEWYTGANKACLKLEDTLPDGIMFPFCKVAYIYVIKASLLCSQKLEP